MGTRGRKRLAWLTALVVGLVVLAGCPHKIDSAMQSWVGHDIGEVMAAWGAPSSSYPVGAGRTAYVWGSFVNTGSTPGYVQAHGNYATYTQGQTMGYQRSRVFICDASGRVISWSWRGL